MGAGGDTIALDAEFGGSLKLGDGNDIFNLSAGAIDTVEAGGGADKIMVSAGIISGTATSIKLGAGTDTLSMSSNFHLVSAQIFGGGGADSIVLSGASVEADGILINLDSTVNGGGADTLLINAFTGGSATVKGKGGKDVITFTDSQLQASAQILGNAGADSITIDEIGSGSNATIGGGSGNDTIVMTGVAGQQTSTVVNAGGADSLSLDMFTGADLGGTVYGGTGQDSITFSADIASTGGYEAAAAIGFKSFSDSTADSADLYTFTNAITGAAGSGTVTFNIALDGLGSAHTASTSLNSASITSGVATFSSVSAVSDRHLKVDTLITTTGQYAIFGDTDSNMSAAYLFIQGGDNDIVAKFVNSDGAMTGLATEAVAGSAFNISLIAPTVDPKGLISTHHPLSGGFFG